MSFRGRGGGRGGGGRGGRGGFRGGGRGGGRGGFQQRDFGPPDHVTELGQVLHTCEGDLVCKCTNEKIPYFNAPVYLENKSQIGKVDDIFGPMTDFYFSVKVNTDMKASSFKKDQKDPQGVLEVEEEEAEEVVVVDVVEVVEAFVEEAEVVEGVEEDEDSGGEGSEAVVVVDLEVVEDEKDAKNYGVLQRGLI
ncbi:H/ACA ribonucleoprotein complex subunit 1 [Stylophora pistillata]|uniref:H/ACA ribonucleoprotein complex subunit n=1 Tax=Stylophora pistillata TaxID=50429 RepID=A0A2B4SES1_STYPI|nr:H/ACA ribonucleoprotein complex subunit 1 [Stylophora pistillata]